MSAADQFTKVTDALHTHGHSVKIATDKRNAKAQCPAHDDHSPSLHVTCGETRVLIKCHAGDGCDPKDILAAIGLTLADLFGEPLPDRAPDDDWLPCWKEGHRKIEEYPYRDEFGKTLYAVARCAEKHFWQWRPDSASKTGKRWQLGNVRRVPYRLPELLAGIANGDTAWIVEGERDVHAILKRHGTVTTNSGGAGKWLPEFAGYFHDADVIVIADRDGPGEAHALHIAEILVPVVNSLTIEQAAYGKDARDHFAGGGHLGNFTTAATPKPWTAPNAITAALLAASGG